MRRSLSHLIPNCCSHRRLVPNRNRRVWTTLACPSVSLVRRLPRPLKFKWGRCGSLRATNAVPQASSKFEVTEMFGHHSRPRGERGGWGPEMRTLRQKVCQKCVPLGRKSSFGMELSRPRRPPSRPSETLNLSNPFSFIMHFATCRIYLTNGEG